MAILEAEAILVSGGAATALATIGWVITVRRHRILSRKQHTFNALLKASFSKEYRAAITALSPHLRKRTKMRLNNKLIPDLIFLLNHYEFLAAGVRLGDIDERLLKYTERGLIVATVKCGETYMFHQRDAAIRKAIFEHLDWLNTRWTGKPPGRCQRFIEFVKGSPVQGRLEEINDN